MAETNQETNNLLSPKLDVIFQILFGEQDSQNITKDLLENILGEKIGKIDLSKNPILRREFPKDKLGILDVVVEIDGKESCDLEMQLVENENIIKRMLYYWGKLYTRNLKSGKDYEKLKRTIVILIADFEVKGLEKEGYHSKWKIIEEKERKTMLTEDLELHILELPKIEREGIEKTELIKWLKFIENPKSKEVKEYMKENVAIKEAKEKLDKIIEDEHIRKIAEWREMAIIEENSMKKSAFRKGETIGEERGKKIGVAEGKKIGLIEGESRGERKKQIETATKLKRLKVDINIIIESTGLTKEEIEKL